MKRKDLKELGLSDEQIDSIMSMNGSDIESHKAQIAELSAKGETTAAQLADATKQIESFKGMNIEEIQKAADEYKAKLEQAQSESAAQISQLKLNHAFENALIAKKARNITAVSALFDKSKLQIGDDGKLIGFDEQYESVFKSDPYQFETAEPPKEYKPVPKITTKSNPQPVSGDAFMEAVAKGAGVDMKDIKIKG